MLLRVEVTFDLAQVLGGEEHSENFLEHLDQQGTPISPHRLDPLGGKIK